jgi:hypothetical protein
MYSFCGMVESGQPGMSLWMFGKELKGWPDVSEDEQR